VRPVLIPLVLAALAAPAIGDPRPASLAMGVSGTVERAPFTTTTLVGLPISIDAGAQVDGELWWHAVAGFGSGADAQDGRGHTFSLVTGPRMQHCWTVRACVAAGVELGWGHSTWDGVDAAPRSFDDVTIDARARVAYSLTPSGQVAVEVSAGPRARYYGRLDAMDLTAWARGLAGGVALVVRN